MKILLFGRDGQLGWELQRALAPLGELIAPGRGGANGLVGDLADTEGVAAAVAASGADVVVNAAAYTAVDRAEAEPELAHRVNAEAPGAIARAVAARGGWFVHFSSDYVFDGSGTRPWHEDDATSPLSVYGRSKRDGEDAVRASGCRHLIVRTSWVYAARGANFAKTMLKLAAERDALRVVADQVGAPTGADLLADLAAHMLRAARQRPELAGTYHAAPAGETSWHGYARHLIAAARAAGRPVKVADDAIAPIATADWPTPAQRPLNSRLDTRKLREAFGLHLPPWQAGIDRFVAETA